MPLGKSPVKRRKRDGTEEAERWCSCGGSLSNSMGGGGGGGGWVGGLGAVLAHQVCAEMPSIRQEDGDFASPLINQRLKAGCSRERGGNLG